MTTKFISGSFRDTQKALKEGGISDPHIIYSQRVKGFFLLPTGRNVTNEVMKCFDSIATTHDASRKSEEEVLGQVAAPGEKMGGRTKKRKTRRKGKKSRRRRTKRSRKSRKRRKTKRRRKSRTKKAGTYSPLARALLTKKMQEKARRYRDELPQALVPLTPKKNRKREREFQNRVGDDEQREPKAIRLL
jgi:hypothetical protein